MNRFFTYMGPGRPRTQLIINILTTLTLLIAAGATTDSAARQVYNVSTGWTFFTSDDASTDASPVVNLPHVAASTGTVNYLKSIDIPLAWEGRRVFLRIGGAATVADIFVGGAHVATHLGGSAPFTVEITDRLTWGQSVPVRIVVGSSPRLDVLPTAGGERVYGGLFRGVEIIVCEPLSISPAASLDRYFSAGMDSGAGGTGGTNTGGTGAPGTDTGAGGPGAGTRSSGAPTPMTSGGTGTRSSSGTPPLTEGGDGIWITTDRLTRELAEGRVRLSLLLPVAIPEGAEARVRFLDAAGNTVTQNALPITATDLEVPFAIPNPHLWQGRLDPFLYTVEVALTTPSTGPADTETRTAADTESRTAADTETRTATGTASTSVPAPMPRATDSLTVTTGFRTIAIDSRNNVTLNDIPIKIHGVILHRDRMVVGTALTPFQIEEDVAFILETGANAVRVAGGRHSDLFYTLCNEAGLLVFNDGPLTGPAYPTDIDFIDTEAFRRNGRRQMTEMISTLYNHPSIVGWGIFSNVSTRGADPVPYIRELDLLAKRLDPQRITAGSSVQDGAINFVTDIVSFDLSLGWTTGLPDGVVPWLEQLRTGWPDLRAGLSYSAGGSIFHQSERLERPSLTSSYHQEGWQTFFHDEYIRYAVDAPGLWGVFVGDMFDSGAAKTASGTAPIGPAGVVVGPVAGDASAIDDRGLVTFDRKDRKDAFWAYKALWNRSEPFVRIAGSRLDTRSEHRQTIRAYSNLPEVELFMGGRSLGRRTGERGVFVWDDVVMRTGANRLEARATGVLGSDDVVVSGASGAFSGGGAAPGAASGAATSATPGTAPGTAPDATPGTAPGTAPGAATSATSATSGTAPGSAGSATSATPVSGTVTSAASGTTPTAPAFATDRVTINIYPATLNTSR